MEKAFLTLVFSLAISLSTFTEAGTYGGGSGTEEDPYQIWTAQELNTIGVNTEDMGRHFKLMADIDMSIYTGEQYNVIGSVSNKFTGTFDGDGYVISNLTYTTSNAYYNIGLFGRTYYATIKNLGVENVLISSNGGWVGGLVGRMEYGSLTDCYAIGSVTGTSWVGGLVGNNEGSLTTCYASCSVTVTTDFGVGGGLVGINESGSSITTCYATGSVGATSSVFLLGGLVGTNNGSLTGCFWDTETSGQSGGVGSGESSGVTGKTTTEMKTLTTFTDAGWDFSDTDGDPADWWMPSNDYPRLAWEFPYGEGSGTAEDPYQIWTAKQMNAIGDNPGDWDKHFKLMADIDMSVYTGEQYNIIGNVTTQFTGTFDGNGHVISNLTYETMEDVDYVGVFGRTNYATIQNLGVENVLLSTGGSWVGGLVGNKNSGMITSCYVTGSVSGDRVGGLVGYNLWGLITNSYTACSVSVTTTSYVGGLVGYNDYSSPISNCYSTGPVSGGDPIGGLIGYNYFNSVVDGCFWDTETSGVLNSAAGTGKTTAEMMTLSTFINAGWDFADVWGIGNGQTYPYLKSLTGINPADSNYSGMVDMEDLAILGANWLKEDI